MNGFDSEVTARLSALGLDWPTPPKPAGDYVPVQRQGDLLFVSGQFPSLDGRPVFRGVVGGTLSIEDGWNAAAIAALNALAQIRGALGTLDHLAGLGRVEGHVACAPGFSSIPAVLDGASSRLKYLLGERGEHARSAFCAAALPLDHSVELVVTACAVHA